MTGFVTVYITTPNAEEANEIGRAMVKSRLAACANIVDGVNSIYAWNGEVDEASETVLLLKTRASLMPEIIDWVNEMHSYSCPCIVAWPISAASQDYLDWIARETREPGENPEL